VRASNEKDEWDDSLESLIIPYEDINTKQQKITGERFPNIVLELCDSCRWGIRYGIQQYSWNYAYFWQKKSDEM